jgi:alpha-tubulin suppressor-like RCC1 family protein
MPLASELCTVIHTTYHNPSSPALHIHLPHLPLSSAGVSVTAVDAGTSHTCAVASGGLWCWGWNAYGQLGINSTADQSNPVAVSLGAGGCAAVLYSALPMQFLMCPQHM